MFNFYKKNKNEQEGAVLVMTLLILTLIMSSAVALSRIIIGEVKMSINTENSVKSYYAANSGVEQALYYVKFARRNADLDPFDDMINRKEIDMGQNQFFSIVQASTTSPGQTSYNVTTSNPASADILSPSGDLVNIDWDPDAAAADGHYYIVSWNITDCFPNHASDRLEISQENIYRTPSSLSLDNDRRIVTCNCSFSSNDACDETLTQFNISDDRYYRFSFKPLDSEVASLTFNVYTDPDDGSSDYITGILSNVSILSEGISKNSRYRLKVEVPALGSLSSAFSYLIFSEEELTKNF